MVTQQSSSPAVPPAVVMSWTAGAPSAPENAGVGESMASSIDPGDLPPSYDAEHVPTEPTTYTFSSHSSNSMLLLPPPESQDTRPLYHISVVMNCFIPTSYITTLRRGAGEYGEFVAEFEMGRSERAETITIHGRRVLLSNVLSKDTGNKSLGTYIWHGRLNPNTPRSLAISLKWDVRDVYKTCYLNGLGISRNLVVARFTAPPDAPATDGKLSPPTTITILPAAHKYAGLVDQIVLSALILERQRLTTKALWK